MQPNYPPADGIELSVKQGRRKERLLRFNTYEYLATYVQRIQRRRIRTQRRLRFRTTYGPYKGAWQALV